MFAEKDAAAGAPVLVDGNEFPGDGGSESAKHGFVGWMDVKRGGDAAEERVGLWGTGGR